MKYKFTILNSVANIFLVGCLIYTLCNYSILSKGEGWGIVSFAVLLFIGFTALIADLIIKFLFENKKHQTIASTIILILYVAILFRELVLLNN